LGMPTDPREPGFEDERVRALRDAILNSFPGVAVEGKITNCDGAWLPRLTRENAIHEDDKLVYEALTGRTWSDIPKQFLREEPDGFVLLTDEAFVAYLAAWLVCALDDMDGENIVREFVIYSFSPSQKQQPDMTPEKIRRLRLMNSEQRATVRSLLAEFAGRERSFFIRRFATNAVGLIDRAGSDMSSGSKHP
jgi:hypothetical protein